MAVPHKEDGRQLARLVRDDLHAVGGDARGAAEVNPFASLCKEIAPALDDFARLRAVGVNDGFLKAGEKTEEENQDGGGAKAAALPDAGSKRVLHRDEGEGLAVAHGIFHGEVNHRGDDERQSQCGKELPSRHDALIESQVRKKRPVPQVERVGDEADEDEGLHSERSIDDAVFPGGDDEHGAEHGHQGLEGRMSGGRRDYGGDDERKSGGAHEFAHFCRQALQIGDFESLQVGDHDAGAELPEAVKRPVERALRQVGVQAGRKRSDSHQKDEGAHRLHGLEFPEKNADERKEDVELFFNGERPEVQERKELRGLVPVAAALEEVNVLIEKGGGAQVLAQLRELGVRHDEPPERQHDGHHEKEIGDDALHAPAIELGKGEVASEQAAEDDA